MTDKTPGSPIYLDHNATTPIDPEAVETMMPYLKGEFGNPSSGYPLGNRAKEGVEKARGETSALLGCQPGEIIFTSGGSESNNLGLKGLINLADPGEFHIITSAIEHPAILNPALFLMELGVKVTILPVDRLGQIDPDDVRKAITSRTMPILAGSDQATRLILKDYHYKSRCYQALNLHFHAPKCPSKASRHIRLKNRLFLRGFILMAKIAF